MTRERTSATLLRMARIEIPKRASVNESAQLIRRCTEAEREREEVEFDLGSTEQMSPFGVALIASSILIRRSEGKACSVTPTDEDEEKEAINEFGLRDLAMDRPLSGKGAVQTAAHGTETDLNATIEAYLASSLGLLAPSIAPISLCLVELLKNSQESALSPIAPIFLARWQKKAQVVRLAVLDRGRGIPASLRCRQIHNLHRANDLEVVEAAVTNPSLSSREQAAGGGLRRVLDTVNQLQGRLTLFSYGAKITWTGNEIRRWQTPPLRGTAIELDLRLRPSSPPA